MAELYQDKLRKAIGQDIYSHLDNEANKEVSLSLQMPLLNQYGGKNYYRPRRLIGNLLQVCSHFEELGIKLSPIDIIQTLFKCKLFFAAKSLDEYYQRAGGSFLSETRLTLKDKSNGVEVLISEHLNRIEDDIRERVLLSVVSHVNSTSTEQQLFFEGLFEKMNAPFECFFDEDVLLEKYKAAEPGRIDYSKEDAKRYFSNPSIGFRISGSETYVHWYASAWLRIFFNILRIAGFIYPGQMDFGSPAHGITAPTCPVVPGTSGFFTWEEDTKKPWEKIPDGCLFRSFGYRGQSIMWLDKRTFGDIEKFILENRIVFDRLKNPWTHQNINDVAPCLDILSSATQIPDLGAKVLLIYCCLEHLFVPKEVRQDNKKYIIGGINALKPDFLLWFKHLYDLRCDYAHKGFVIRSDKLLSLVKESMNNVVALMVAKLSLNN
jgi:hypothetical protein